MIQNEVFKGNWSIPGETGKYSGTLTFNPIDGAELEVHGAFRGMHMFSNLEIVHGQTLDGWITLVDVRRGNSTGSNITGASVTKYIPTYIFVGHQFNSIEDIRFQHVKFSVFNLIEWINPTAVQEDSNMQYYKLNYSTPVAIPITCYNECSGTIECYLSRKSNFGFYEVEIKQSASIKLAYSGAKFYRDIIEDTLIFARLLTLFTYEQSYPIEISLQNDTLQETFSEDGQKRHILKSIRLIYRSPFYSPAYKSRKFYQHLVTYGSISADFNSILPKWFRHSKELEQPLELLLRSFTNRYDFSIEKFMDISKALELFHRKRFPNEILPKVEFNKRKKKFIMKGLTSEERQWIQRRMEHGNEPSLFDRLRALVDTYAFSYFDKRVPDRKVCCRQAADNRNYYTHFNERLKKKALNGKGLFDLMENLKLILLAGILNDIGISASVFEQSIRGLIY
jgi:hypothetical protein